MTIGERIRARRVAAGWPQTDLAERLEVDVMQVSRWERDEVSPSVGSLRKLAGVFGCSLDDLASEVAS